MPTKTQDDEIVTLQVAGRILRVSPGCMVLVSGDEHDGDAYGAVVVRIYRKTVHLTFTPEGRPRVVEHQQIICVASAAPATIALSSVPRHQPTPNRVPYRRRVTDDVSFLR